MSEKHQLSSVSQLDIAWVFDVSERTVQRWHSDDLPRHGEGRGVSYSLREVIAWALSRERRNTMEEFALADDGDLEAARTEKEWALAKLRRLEYDQKSGRVLDANEVQGQWFEVVRLTRDRILGLPDRLADVVATETDPAEIHALLSAELREVLTALADDIAPAHTEG